LQDVFSIFANTPSFTFIAHSFGSLLALEIAKSLEAAGKTGQIIILDGSPLLFKRITEAIAPADTRNEVLQDEILNILMSLNYPESKEQTYKTALSGTSWEEKLESFMVFSKPNKQSKKRLTKASIKVLYNRLIIVRELDVDSLPVLQTTKMTLVVPTEKFFKDLPTDYNLSRYFIQKIDTMTCNGNHISVLKSSDFSNLVSKLLTN
jgi:thioesterase domain-containing protein